MRKTLCLLLFLAMLPLQGCAQRVELAFVAVCLGVDAAEDGVTLTVKCPSYGGGSRQEEKDAYTVLSAQGEDWPRAVAALYAASPVSPQFSQLREIVISRPSFDILLPEELLRCADQLPGIRVHALVTVCPGCAADYIEALKPEIGKRLSKYLDISLRHAEEQGMLPATSLSCALRDLSGPWRDPVLAYADTGKVPQGAAMGSLGITLLTSREVQLYRLLRGESQALLLKSGGRYYGVSARGRAKREVTGSTLLLTVPVYITYSLYDAPPDEEAANQLQSELQSFLRRLQAAGCDALGFGCAAVREYDTLPEWLSSGWESRYRRADAIVRVEARARQQPLQ
ncbi:MAG: hypothetical protein IJ157_07710 [Clostridia bacterium]|nr:hypothetical protein [Clostridia bacterium]